jgi:hypothetical protein
MSSLRDSCYLCGIIAAARAKNGALKQFPIANQEFLVFGALFSRSVELNEQVRVLWLFLQVAKWRFCGL